MNISVREFEHESDEASRELAAFERDTVRGSRGGRGQMTRRSLLERIIYGFYLPARWESFAFGAFFALFGAYLLSCLFR